MPTRLNEAQQLMIDACADRALDIHLSTPYFYEFLLSGIYLKILSTMSYNLAAMNVGLRVLVAISDNINPAPGDVEELLRLAPECSALPTDELACQVVQRALKKRAGELDLVVAPRKR